MKQLKLFNPSIDSLVTNLGFSDKLLRYDLLTSIIKNRIYIPSGSGMFRHSAWNEVGHVSQQTNIPPLAQMKHQAALTCCGIFPILKKKSY